MKNHTIQLNSEEGKAIYEKVKQDDSIPILGAGGFFIGQWFNDPNWYAGIVQVSTPEEYDPVLGWFYFLIDDDHSSIAFMERAYAGRTLTIPEWLAIVIEDAGADILDDHVHDIKSREASAINNEGIASQIRFLKTKGYTYTSLMEAALIDVGTIHSCNLNHT